VKAAGTKPGKRSGRANAIGARMPMQILPALFCGTGISRQKEILLPLRPVWQIGINSAAKEPMNEPRHKQRGIVCSPVELYSTKYANLRRANENYFA